MIFFTFFYLFKIIHYEGLALLTSIQVVESALLIVTLYIIQSMFALVLETIGKKR